ncbi:hypothetical protein EBT16_06380 [bacterium]|nr:hypothetical protein [bacterium]
MCHPATNEETRRNYCSRCEEVRVGYLSNLCKDCCYALDAEYDARRAEEDWKKQQEEETGRRSCRSCGESPAGAGGICDACAPAEYHGYEADDEHLLYWEQHAEG